MDIKEILQIEVKSLLCQERGVLSGSEYFLKPVSERAEQFQYYQVSCGHYHCEKGYRVERSYMPALLLMSIQQGRMEIHSENRVYHAGAGDVILLECTKEHCYFTDSYVEFYWMHIAGSNSFAICSYLKEQNNGIIYHAPNTTEISDTMYRMIAAYRNHKQLRESEESVDIYRMLCSLMPDMREDTAEEETDIMDALHLYIEEHLSENITLEQLAEHAQLSVSYIIRMFQKRVGVTPYEYVIRMRMDHARFLLKTSQYSVKEISQAVGYRSQQGFINAFVQHIGISPGKYRRAPLE